MEIVQADLENEQHQRDVIALTNSYAMDPMGNSAPLPAATLDRLIDGLRRHPTTVVFLAYDGGRAQSPWYFPTVEDYGARLGAAGFAIDSIALVPRPTPLPGDILGWLDTFAESFTRVLPAAERPAFLDEVRARIQPRLCDAEGRWTADYVRLRFAATYAQGK